MHGFLSAEITTRLPRMKQTHVTNGIAKRLLVYRTWYCFRVKVESMKRNSNCRTVNNPFMEVAEWPDGNERKALYTSCFCRWWPQHALTLPWHLLTFPSTPKVPYVTIASPVGRYVTFFSYWQSWKKQGRGRPIKFLIATITTSLNA